MASTPEFTTTARLGTAIVNTQNTNRDGSGTLTTVFTAGSGGSRMFRVYCKASTTTAAGMLRLFVSSGGTSYPWKEYQVSPITLSSNYTKGWETEDTLFDFVLPSGASIKASATGSGESFSVIIVGGDF